MHFMGLGPGFGAAEQLPPPIVPASHTGQGEERDDWQTFIFTENHKHLPMASVNGPLISAMMPFDGTNTFPTCKLNVTHLKTRYHWPDNLVTRLSVIQSADSRPTVGPYRVILAAF